MLPASGNQHAPVDVVAQEHEGVERREVDGQDEGSQRRRAAVNVANRYRASFGHGAFVSLVLRKGGSLPWSLSGGFHFTCFPHTMS